MKTFEFQAAYEVVRPVRKVAKIVVAKRSFVNMKRFGNAGFFQRTELCLEPHIPKVVDFQGGCFSAILAVLLLTASAAAQELVSFPTEDGGVVYADVYGQGERGVVLAHGGPFTKESWAKQAPVLVKAGFRVVAIDFRGRGKSRGAARASASSLSSSSSLSSDEGYRFDVLAAVRYLRDKGAKSVSVVGASFGADAAAEAAVAEPGEIDRLVIVHLELNLSG